MKPILEIQNISKKYRIKHLSGGYLSLRERMMSSFKLEKNSTEDFWALKDVSFDVQRGESIGIIGRNGAGKSTLLKILSKITPPSSGKILSRGRVASLLEVGTGFHPELTGRENIFFNGSLLGMRRREIEAKFDEIVDFSGVEKFLDTPLKHFSSGMQLRLAFAVASFLEPEILVIDEVLAVGDAEFQKKCMGKMNEVSKTEGRTILFVSHNLAAVSQLCQKAVLLQEGRLVDLDATDAIIDKYISHNKTSRQEGKLANLDLRKGNGLFRMESIKLLNKNKEPISVARTGAELILEFKFNKEVLSSEGNFKIDFSIDSDQGIRVGWFSSDLAPSQISKNFNTLYLRFPKFSFGMGSYYVSFYSTMNGIVADNIHQAFMFEVEEGDFYGTGKVIPRSQTIIYNDFQIYSN